MATMVLAAPAATLVLLAGGCVASRPEGHVFQPIAELADGMAVVYLYNPFSRLSGAALTLSRSGRKVVYLQNGGYYPLRLRPGPVEFSAEIGSQATGLETASVTLDLSAGQTYFIRAGIVNEGWSEKPPPQGFPKADGTLREYPDPRKFAGMEEQQRNPGLGIQQDNLPVLVLVPDEIAQDEIRDCRRISRFESR